MLVKLHPDNPQKRFINELAELLRHDGVIVFPTDTVYALACSIDSKKGFERLCRLRNIDPRKAIFSMVASSIAQAAPYLNQLPTPAYRILKSHLPGPFTFVINSGKQMPAHMRNGRKTIGLRIPDHSVTTSIVEALGVPLVITSLRSDDEILEYYNDPEEIFAEFGKQVDSVIDSGPGSFEPSTVVDMTTADINIIRQGKGDFQES